MEFSLALVGKAIHNLRMKFIVFLAAIVVGAMGARGGDAATNGNYALWDLALSKTNIHRFATLFTAQDVRDHLADDGAIDFAIDWCKKTGITHVFLEAYIERRNRCCCGRRRNS